MKNTDGKNYKNRCFGYRIFQWSVFDKSLTDCWVMRVRIRSDEIRQGVKENKEYIIFKR